MARNTGQTGHIEGMKEAREALQALGAHVERQVGKLAVNAAADVFIPEIRRRAPVSTIPTNPTPGSLKQSIGKKQSRSRKNLARVEIRADDVAAVPNELGLSRRDFPIQPFMRPAINAKREEAAQALADKIRDEVENGPWVKGRE